PAREAGDGAARGDGGGVPGVQPLADALVDGAEQRPPATPPQEAVEGRAYEARGGVSRGRRPHALHRPLSVAALGRNAAAGRDRTRPRLPALDPANGRALRVRPRPDAGA